MAYNLGKVAPHVAAAANEVGPRFGIKTIGGWRAGPPVKYGAYDHPLGLALDFMTNNGQALADYLVANADRLGVNFVIWNHKTWNRAKGWHAYTGDNPHTDHVHGSFFNAGDAAKRTGFGGAMARMTAGLPGPGDLTGAVSDAAGALREMAAGVTAIGDFAAKLRNWWGLPSSYVRMTAGGLGIGLVLVGVILLVREVRQ